LVVGVNPCRGKAQGSRRSLTSPCSAKRRYMVLTLQR
jgi:hypothetical protein